MLETKVSSYELIRATRRWTMLGPAEDSVRCMTVTFTVGHTQRGSHLAGANASAYVRDITQNTDCVWVLKMKSPTAVTACVVVKNDAATNVLPVVTLTVVGQCGSFFCIFFSFLPSCGTLFDHLVESR